MGSNTTYQTVTNLPDQATQAFRNNIFPILSDLGRRQANVYGSVWDAETQQFVRDPNVKLTASQNADIEAANAQVRSGQGAGQFGLVRGGANIGNAAGMDIYGAGAGAYGQAGNLYNQAAAGQSGLAGQGQFNAATGMFEQAAGTDTAGMFSPYAQQAQGQYGQAANLYGQSTDALGLSSASPYLQAAGQSSAQNVGQYMNPYNEQVTNRIAQLGARNLSENILPQISSDFIKAGGYGSTRQRDLVGRAARDTQEAILGQQAQALQSGYGQGLAASSADLSRYGQLGATAGSLGTQQQQLLQSAGAGLGNLGTSYAGLGSTYAGLAGADAGRQIAAGQGLSSIGQSNIQASQTDLARQLAAGQGQAGIGAGLGNLMQANAANQLAAGQANIGLGQSTQQMNLRDAAALQAVGESEQAQQQRGIDASRGQVAAENAAPFYNVGQAANIASNTPAGGQTQSTTTSAPGASLAGQLGGLAATAVGAYGLAKAKGGAIKKGSLKKASYGKLPKRGLGMFARAS